MLSKTEQMILLEMLRLKYDGNKKINFENQEVMKSKKFFEIMGGLFKKKLINKIEKGRKKSYQFTDYGYNRAIEISGDFDTPEKYREISKEKVIFMIVPKWV